METTAQAFSESFIRRTAVLILVLLGTNPYDFSRLVRAADAYAKLSQREVFIQLGYTKEYVPKYAKYKRFIARACLLERIDSAELVITQGGFGSIADCLSRGKIVVAVPRKPELKEAPDDQEELVRALEAEGRLIGVYDIEKLEDAIEAAGLLEPKNTGRSSIPKLVSDFIERNRD
jgi:UDP-N-acetylglucosamine transferase subunit ALG13